jgi:hypothetical protein
LKRIRRSVVVEVSPPPSPAPQIDRQFTRIDLRRMREVASSFGQPRLQSEDLFGGLSVQRREAGLRGDGPVSDLGTLRPFEHRIGRS